MKNILILIFVISLFLLNSCNFTDVGDTIDIPDEGNFDIVDNANVVDAAYNLTIDNDILFVSDGKSRISVFDCFNPMFIESVTSYLFNNASNERVYESVRDRRNILYCANGNLGFYGINTTNPASLNIANYNSELKARSVDLYEDGGSNNDLLVVTDNNSWKILKITGTGQTIQLSNWDFFINRVVYKIKIAFPYVYIGTDQSIEVFDISNPYAPSHVSTEYLSGFRNFQIIGSYLVVTTSSNLIFYNISSPSAIFPEISYELPFTPTSFIIYQNKLLIAYENKKLVYYEINSLNAIVEISSKLFNDYIYDMDYNNGYFYLCCGYEGIVCLDVLDAKKL